MKKLGPVLSVCLIIGSILLAKTKDPVAVVFQVKGNVEYSKNGEKWQRVRRNKFLFSGYQIRSAADGSAKITNRSSGKDLFLSPNTILEVTSHGLQPNKGELTEIRGPNPLLSGLVKRFGQSSSNKSVRQHSEFKTQQLSVARYIKLTDDYPHFVWENINKNFRYELKIGSETYRIPMSDNEVVRVQIKPFFETQTISLEAYKGDEKVQELQPYHDRGDKKKQKVHWMSDQERSRFDESIKAIVVTDPSNVLLLGSFFEKEGMWIAAMDQYRKYLDENPDDIEMTPYLFRVYKKLKLQVLYHNELKLWTQAMKE